MNVVTRLVSLAFLCAILAGCASAPHVPYELSKADSDRFGKDVLRVNHANRDPWIFGINDCIVYKARVRHQDIVGWDVVLASDWGGSYPKWFTVCTRTSIKWDGKWVQAFLCAQAIGAGGGCADGGDYRSRTGDAQGWQYGVGDAWIILPNNDLPAATSSPRVKPLEPKPQPTKPEPPR